jgi:hypothetical protein
MLGLLSRSKSRDFLVAALRGFTGPRLSPDHQRCIRISCFNGDLIAPATTSALVPHDISGIVVLGFVRFGHG